MDTTRTDQVLAGVEAELEFLGRRHEDQAAQVRILRETLAPLEAGTAHLQDAFGQAERHVRTLRVQAAERRHHLAILEVKLQKLKLGREPEGSICHALSSDEDEREVSPGPDGSSLRDGMMFEKDIIQVDLAGLKARILLAEAERNRMSRAWVEMQPAVLRHRHELREAITACAGTISLIRETGDVLQLSRLRVRSPSPAL